MGAAGGCVRARYTKTHFRRARRPDSPPHHPQLLHIPASLPPSGTCVPAGCQARCQAEPVQVTLGKRAGWGRRLGRGMPFQAAAPTAPPHAAQVGNHSPPEAGLGAPPGSAPPCTPPALAGGLASRAGGTESGQCNFPVSGVRPLGEPRPGRGGWRQWRRKRGIRTGGGGARSSGVGRSARSAMGPGASA